MNSRSWTQCGLDSQIILLNILVLDRESRFSNNLTLTVSMVENGADREVEMVLQLTASTRPHNLAIYSGEIQ